MDVGAAAPSAGVLKFTLCLIAEEALTVGHIQLPLCLCPRKGEMSYFQEEQLSAEDVSLLLSWVTLLS